MHAFIYKNGVMTDLNNLIDAESGWSLTFAIDINENGQIVGAGNYNGALHAYLLMPMPATGTYGDGDLAPPGTPDGVVNVADYMVALQIVPGTVQPTIQELSHGDLYPVGAPDGQINLSDVLQLRSLIFQ